MKTSTVVGVAVAVCVPALAVAAVELNEFQPNTPIHAADVNANFDKIAQALDALEAENQQLRTDLDALRSAAQASIIDEDLVIDISAAQGCAAIIGALADLSTRQILPTANVQIRVADGTYTCSQPITVAHRDGEQIWLLGNTTTPTAVELSFSSSGIEVGHGHTLGYADGFHLIGSGSDTGIRAGYGATVHLGPNVIVSEFDNGVAAETGSKITASGVTSEKNAQFGFIASDASMIAASGATAQENGLSGFAAFGASSMNVVGATSSLNGGSGFWAYGAAAMDASEATASNNAVAGFNAEVAAGMRAIGATAEDSPYGFIASSASYINAEDGIALTNTEAGFSSTFGGIMWSANSSVTGAGAGSTGYQAVGWSATAALGPTATNCETAFSAAASALVYVRDDNSSGNTTLALPPLGTGVNASNVDYAP